MAFSGKNWVFFVLAFLPYAVLQVDALNYANFQSANGMFKLHWTYNNGKLIFKMTCKTTGWCAVGFTATADGRNMQNYDMAVGGVASNKPYLDVSLTKLFSVFSQLCSWSVSGDAGFVGTMAS